VNDWATVGDLAAGELIVIAVLTTLHWSRHRARGSGWAAATFTLLASAAVADRAVAVFNPAPTFLAPFDKMLVVGLLAVPLCLFEFAAAFRRVRPWAHVAAFGLTGAAGVLTLALPYLPRGGMVAPAHFVAYRAGVAGVLAVLLTGAASRLWLIGQGHGTVAARRARIFGAAIGALDVLAVGAVAGLARDHVFVIAAQGLAIVIGVLLTLVLPSFVGSWWTKRGDEEFQRAIADLVSVSDSEDMAASVLPHACSLVGAASAALVDAKDNVIAHYQAGDELSALQRHHAAVGEEPFGPAHHLKVEFDPFMGYFGRVELRRLDALDDLVRLATERCDAKAALTHQMFHDPLTGLPNRDLFLDRLSQSLAVFDRHGMHLAVLFIDLDRFKLINDRLDHSAGDVVLIEVARRLISSLRAGDTVARIGGDEFVAVLEVRNEEEAQFLADSLCMAIGRPMPIGEREVSVTASIGLVVTQDRAADPSALLRDADWAMYLAKEAGRDNVKVFEEHVRNRRVERMDLEKEFLQAIEDQEFRLHYQPVFRLEDNVGVGCEALIRWQHPERGLIFPDTFLPMAEETGLIVHLGRWILEEACRQAAEWLDDLPGDAPFTMWVNQSAAQFHRSDMVRSVLSTLEKTGLEPSSLGIEITETTFMSDLERVRTTMSDLNWNGVAMAIDDFGTGFSSLSYLKRFPVDILKVDRSFVQGIGHEPETSLVSATLALAHSLKIMTVAEGVESPKQGEWLRDAGCEHVQGYLFSKPLAPEEALKVLIKSRRTGGDPSSRFEAYRELTSNAPRRPRTPRATKSPAAAATNGTTKRATAGTTRTTANGVAKTTTRTAKSTGNGTTKATNGNGTAKRAEKSPVGS
jgi:diguanylate cyclase (GGDEF)-like protein